MASAARLLVALAVGWLLAPIFPASSGALAISPNPSIALPTPVATSTSTASIELGAAQSGVPAGWTVPSGSVSPRNTTRVFRAEPKTAALLGLGMMLLARRRRA